MSYGRMWQKFGVLVPTLIPTMCEQAEHCATATACYNRYNGLLGKMQLQKLLLGFGQIKEFCRNVQGAGAAARKLR